jgi:hypothetical protein
MLIDLCHSVAERDWAVAYHTQLQHQNIRQLPVSSGNVSVSIVEADPQTQFKLTGKHFEMGVQWIVTADP